MATIYNSKKHPGQAKCLFSCFCIQKKKVINVICSFNIKAVVFTFQIGEFKGMTANGANQLAAHTRVS